MIERDARRIELAKNTMRMRRIRKRSFTKKKKLFSARERREREKKPKTIIVLSLTDALICIARNRPHSSFLSLAIPLPSLFQPQSSISASSASIAILTRGKKPPGLTRYINFFSLRQKMAKQYTSVETDRKARTTKTHTSSTNNSCSE